MLRHRLRLLLGSSLLTACCLTMAVAVTLAVGVARQEKPPPAQFALQYWQWGTARALNPAEQADCAAMPVDALLWWCGSVAEELGAPHFHDRGGKPGGWTGKPAWAVVRVEPSCSPMLGSGNHHLIQAILAGLVRAQHAGPVGGLQVDWDVPTSRLGAYASLLGELRQALPAGMGLSCTGLVTWLGSEEVSLVAAAVDWWVPQCYSTDVPDAAALDRPLVCRESPALVAERCARLQRPFYIGLPTFEQASLWDQDGTVLAAALPISAEDAFAADLEVGEAIDGGVHAQERLLRCTANRETVINGRNLPSGAILMIGEPTVGSLRAEIQAVREHGGPWCRGLSLFRLPGEDAFPCLSTAQVRAAWSTSSPAPAQSQPAASSVTWQWRGGPPAAWTLVITNQGLADWLNIPAPLRLAVDSAAETGNSPSSVRVQPAFDGIPTGPAHANGSLVVIPFLRAGGTIQCGFAATTSSPPTCRPVTNQESP